MKRLLFIIPPFLGVVGAFISNGDKVFELVMVASSLVALAIAIVVNMFDE